jgi:O-antigen/teichoic acid export membrane protein
MRRLVLFTRRAPAGSSYTTGILYGFAGFAAISVITLLTSVLSARLYGITAIGEYALVLAPVTAVTLLSTVREQPAMVRELAKLPPRHPRATGVCLAVFSFSFALTLLVAAVGVAGCYFAFNGPLHDPRLFVPAAVSLLGYLLIVNTCWNIDGVLGAFRASRELFDVRLHQALVNPILLAAALPITHSVWALVIAYLGSWLSTLPHRLLLLGRVIRWRVPRSELRAGFRTLREIVHFGLKLTPGWLASGASDVSGVWILGATSSVNTVGAYSRAWNLAYRLNDLNWRITEMLLPTLVQRRASGDHDGFRRVLVDSLRYTAFGMLLPAAVGGGAAVAIMHVFGTGFAAAAPALRWLLFVPLLQSLMAIQGTALMAANRPSVTAGLQVLRLAITVTVGVWLSQSFGMVGMAVAMVAGVLLCCAACVVAIRSVLGVPVRSLWSTRQVLGLITACASGFLVSNLAVDHLSGVLGMLVALILGSIVFIGIAVGVGGMSEQDRERAQRAAERLASLRRSRLEGLRAA